MYPCDRTTKHLEGHALEGHHGAIWEAIPAMEHLLRHLEKLKQSISSSDTRIWECVNNSWAVLNKYYELTDNNHSVYVAATLLHPGMRMQHFYNNWTGETANWISIMEAKCRDT